MTGVGWRCVEAAASLLEEREREAVLGDLAEAEESVWRGMADVVGLAIRRQAAPWRSWRPWAAGFALAWPGSLFLMGLSLSVSHGIRRWMDAAFSSGASSSAQDLPILLLHILLLTAGAWTAGVVLGAVSRRTIWVSIFLCCLPCTYCMAEFPSGVLQSLCLFLFLVPAFWGVRLGLRGVRLRRDIAVILAVGLTLAALPVWRSGASLFWSAAMIWPGWYLAASGRSRSEKHI